jgi:hypothetical protein
MRGSYLFYDCSVDFLGACRFPAGTFVDLVLNLMEPTMAKKAKKAAKKAKKVAKKKKK